MTRSSFHSGLDARRVVQEAVRLTTESHLLGWSIRDLAGRLGVVPSVVYHHVSSKDLLIRHVVEQVLEPLTAPAADLAWQPWFRTLLDSLHPLVSAHPGVSKWLLMHGPTFPNVLPIIDAGITVLRQAGFSRPTITYSILLNTPISAIMLTDERRLRESDGPRDHASVLSEFQATGNTSPGLAAIATEFASLSNPHSREAEDLRHEYFRLVVDTTIAGLASQAGPPEVTHRHPPPASPAGTCEQT